MSSYSFHEQVAHSHTVPEDTKNTFYKPPPPLPRYGLQSVHNIGLECFVGFKYTDNFVEENANKPQRQV